MYVPKRKKTGQEIEYLLPGEWFGGLFCFRQGRLLNVIARWFPRRRMSAVAGDSYLGA
jgi:hypothetical protein